MMNGDLKWTLPPGGLCPPGGCFSLCHCYCKESEGSASALRGLAETEASQVFQEGEKIWPSAFYEPVSTSALSRAVAGNLRRRRAWPPPLTGMKPTLVAQP